MKKEFIIDVTQEDIDRGRRGKCMECPIALAAARATGRASAFTSHWAVNVDGADFDEIDNATTPEIRKFIGDFDCGEKVSPFSFKMTFNFPEPQVSHA